MIRLWHDDGKSVQLKEGKTISFDNGFAKLVDANGFLHIIPREKIIRIEEDRHEKR